MPIELLNLWSLYHLFSEDLVATCVITKSSLSLQEKLEYLKETPNFFIRKAAERKIHSYTHQDSVTSSLLPFDSLEYWFFLIEIFKLRPQLQQTSLLIQLILMIFWASCFSKYLFLNIKPLLVLTLLMSALIVFTFVKNLWLTFFLCRFYLWSKNTPLQYIWKESTQIPTVLENTYENLWKRQNKETLDKKKSIEMTWVSLKIKIFYRQKKLVQLTDLLLLFCYFLALMKVGQDFFENLYSNQSSFLGKF